MRPVPEKLVNFTAYKDGSTYLGTADITLPTLEALTETVRGAGIAGEVDSPTLGHYGSMTVTLNWRTITPEAMQLHEPVSHALDFRGAQQVYNSATGEYSSQGVKVTVRAVPKSGDLGTFAPGTMTNSTNELEVSYLKIQVDGKTLIEIDKFNFICLINGRDHLAQVRQQLGL